MLGEENRGSAVDGPGEKRDARRYLKLIPISDAIERIYSRFGPVEAEFVRVDRMLGRVSASVARSRVDIPRIPTCAMDGYAIRSRDTEGASQSEPSRLRVKAPPRSRGPGSKSVVRMGEALPVSTGDALPAGADAVVRVEGTRIEDGTVVVPRKVPEEKNVSSKAEDVAKGQVILRKGEIVNAAGMALLMSAGLARVRAYKSPRVGVLSVGSELKRFGDVRSSKKTNNYADMVVGYLSTLGVESEMIGIAKDEAADIRARIAKSTHRLDMVLTIGGVSVGNNDLLPEAALLPGDSRVVFHGLRAVPMRPVGVASVRGKPVVMLPGHAVSVALSFFVVAIPVLNVIGGLPPGSRRTLVRAVAGGEFSNERPIDAFVLARLERNKGGFSAHPLGWGSNLMFNLSRANGFVHLKPRERIESNSALDVELFGGSELSRLSVRVLG